MVFMTTVSSTLGCSKIGGRGPPTREHQISDLVELSTSGLIIMRDMTLNDVRDVREVLRSHTMYLDIITTIYLRY